MSAAPELERAKARVVVESPVHGPVLLAEIARLEGDVQTLKEVALLKTGGAQ